MEKSNSDQPIGRAGPGICNVERMVSRKEMTKQEAETMAAEFFKSLKEMTTVKR